MNRQDIPALWNVRFQEGPGKFEGESCFTYHFYEAMMNGDGEVIYSDDVGGDSVTSITLDPTDEYDARIILEAFGEPPVNGEAPYAILLSESSNGFVTGEIVSKRYLEAIEKHYAKLQETE